MKLYITTVVVFMCLSNGAWSKEDPCVAEKPSASIKPEKVVEVKDYKIEISKDERTVTEKFSTDKIQSVIVVQTGCAHAGKTITFKDKSLKWNSKKFDNQHWINEAKRLLEELPKSVEAASPVLAILKSLESSLISLKPDVTKNVYHIQITDNDGYNTIGIEVNKNPKGIELSVILDISL